MKRFLLRLIGALLIIAVVAAVSAVAPAIPTSEKEYEITDADVSIRLENDGSLLVHEALPFDFTGSFSGAYRDIPVLDGVQLSDFGVREAGDGRYRPGGNTALGSLDSPGTFGVERSEHGYRVVWHYSAADETRTFDLTYRVTGATKVYDDVVDVAWNVWGSQWDFWLDSLDADIAAASGAAPEGAWVRPRSLGVDPEVGADASVAIDRVPEGEAVGFRAVFPRDSISSTGGAKVEAGDGLAKVEGEEAALDDDYETIDKLENFAADNALLLALIAAAAAIAGRSRGRVIRRITWPGDAPRVRPASSSRGSIRSHRPPTMRITTATLKNTWEAMIAAAVPLRSTPSTPEGPIRARNATPTTRVGSTKGTTVALCRIRRPGKLKREVT